MRPITTILTSESVTEGHPDKVADQISDAILDRHLEQDRRARVAVETLVKGGTVILAGEIESTADVDHDAVVRELIRRIGYVDPLEPFSADRVRVRSLLTRQSREIGDGVRGFADPCREQGAGDQGMMFGYATDESPERLPLPLALAHRLTQGLRAARHEKLSHASRWLRPDGKAQVSVEYHEGVPVRVKSVVVSTQHTEDVDRSTVEKFVREALLPHALGRWNGPSVVLYVNPAGTFVHGGPSVDAGLTGRKIMVDTYGGLARHGGGAFSGKDATKVDRSAAYLARLAARSVVDLGLARRCEVQVAYAIGRAQPVSLAIDTFGTGGLERAREFVTSNFDFRPAAILERLRLDHPGFLATASGGHFGRDEFAWERVAAVEGGRSTP